MQQQEFLEKTGDVVVTPLRTTGGDMTGWVISKDDVTLERNRGGVRSFKEIGTIAVFCIEHGIDAFSVKGL